MRDRNAHVRKAAELAVQRLDFDVPRITRMRERIIDGTLGNIKDSFLTGHRTKRLPNLASFRFRFIEGEGMLLRERRMAIGGGFLHYEVHWSLERSATLPCWRPSAARFVGFKGED